MIGVNPSNVVITKLKMDKDRFVSSPSYVVRGRGADFAFGE